ISFEASRSASSSLRPMIVSARLIRRTVAALDTRITSCQYSGWRTNSFAYRYSTESGTPTARNASLKYSAHTRRFSRLPPSLSLMYACQSARKMIAWNPAWTRSVIFDPITKAVPTCMRPEGSRPTYALGAARSRRTRNSSRVTTSSVPRTNVSSRSSGGIAPRNLQFRDKAFNRLVRRSGLRSGGLREASHGLKKGTDHPRPGKWYGGNRKHPARRRTGVRAPGSRRDRLLRCILLSLDHCPDLSFSNNQGGEGVGADRELPPREGPSGERPRDRHHHPRDRQAGPSGSAGTVPHDSPPDVHHKRQCPRGRRLHRLYEGRERRGLCHPREQLRRSGHGHRDDDAPCGDRRYHPRRSAVEEGGN